MRIAPLEPSHLEEVAAIEAKDGAARWSQEQFKKELEGEFQRFFVVQEPPAPDILGYGGYWKAGPEAQITNLVVRADSQCRGIGRRLLEFIFDCARGEGCESCTLEVRAFNVHAQKLYASLGFVVKGTRKAMYQNPEDDAVMMEKQL